MKHYKKRSVHIQPLYPNGASSRYYLERIINTVTAIASGLGFLTVLLFFFLL